MAYTLAAEIRDVRRAIQELLRGAQSATVSSSGGQHSYTRVDLDKLEAREKILLARYSRSKNRKRTAPDFS
jgi:hypothetical protein